MSKFFPEPYELFGGDISVTVDPSNYTTKADFKNVTYVDTSSFALKTNLANLKTGVDKLMSVLTDLSKLDNIVKIKKKGDEIYVKWTGYHNSFNTWIDKKDLV